MNRRLKNLCWRFLRFAFSLFRLDNRKVFFRSYGGLNYSCNPKAISEKLHEIAPDMKIVWSFKNPSKVENVPEYVTKVKRNSFQEIKSLFTSKFWVMNAGFVFPKKRKGQIFIDTWHGDRAFKKVEISADGKENIADSYKVADVVLSGSDYGDRVFRNAMRFSGKILRVGSPRNDIFFSKDLDLKTESVKRGLGIAKNARVLMFAPTFRGAGKGVDILNFSSLLDKLEARDGEKWVCLVRQHYKVPFQKKYSTDVRIMNVSAYPDMQELLLISNVVISDYSSLVGDFALLERPIVLYVPDLEEYVDSRGLYFDLKKSPFVFATEESELFEKILKFDPESARKNCRRILDFYGDVRENGTASERVCKWMLENS